MALIQASRELLREPVFPSAFNFEEFRDEVNKVSGAPYLYRAYLKDKNSNYTERDPYMLAHYPLFDEIEECEKRAVEVMTLHSYHMHKASTYEGAFKFFDIARNWAMIYMKGCEELHKVYPELSTTDAVSHCNLLFYLYVDLHPSEQTIEEYRKKYCFSKEANDDKV